MEQFQSHEKDDRLKKDGSKLLQPLAKHLALSFSVWDARSPDQHTGKSDPPSNQNLLHAG